MSRQTREFFALARPYRGRLIVALLLNVVLTITSLSPPLVNRYLLDHVIEPRNFTTALVVTLVTMIFMVHVWNASLGMIYRITVAIIGQRFVVDLRTNLYRRVLDLSMRFHAEKGSGPIMSRLMTDAGLVQTMITGDALGSVSAMVALLFGMGMVFTINWRLALVLVVIVVLYVIAYRRFALRIRQANIDLRELMDHVTGQLQERLAGVRLVKTYCRERDETNAFLNSTERALAFGLRSQMLNVSLSATTRIIAGLGSTLIFCGAAFCVLCQPYSLQQITALGVPFYSWLYKTIFTPMSYGNMQALDNFVWMVLNPALNLTMVAGTITQALVSLDRIMELSRQQPDIVDRPDAQDLPDEVRGDLRLEDVNFTYKQDETLFQGLNLHLEAGKMTALVGHTGCGKTTVTSLLLRLWEVQRGRVTLDGYDIREVTLRSLRRHIGVVPQEPVIFEASVFDNIAYAKPEATQEEVEEAAMAAQIHQAILALPDGYQTWLGKQGAKVSVGEKQRIAIARAILLKPAVLILDEATSSLDSESEAALQEAPRTVLRGRTSVVVAHRLSTIVEADCIIAMDHGEVKESGTHEELMEIEGGQYRRLYEELKGQHDEEVQA